MQHDVDVEVLLPHFLEGFGDGLVALQCIEENFNRREVLSIGIAGLGQKLAGRGHIFLDFGLAGVSGRVGRRQKKSRLLPGAHDGFGDGVAVNGHGQGLAHAFVVQRRPRDVEFVKIGAQQRIDVDQVGFVFAVKRDFRRRGLRIAVKLPGTEHAFGGVVALRSGQNKFCSAGHFSRPNRSGFSPPKCESSFSIPSEQRGRCPRNFPGASTDWCGHQWRRVF